MTKKEASHTTLLKEAIALHRSGRLDDAKTRYKKFLNVEKNHAEATHLLGTLHLQQGKHAKAIDLITRAIKLGLTSADAYVNLGAAYRANTQPKKAIKAFRKGLDLNPKRAEAYFNLGHTLRDVEDFEGAVHAYKSYLDNNPQDAEAYCVLGDTFMALNQNTEAIDAYESALIYDSERADALGNIATIMRNCGWYHGAQVVMDRAINMKTSNPDLLRTRGAICMQLGDLKTGWEGLENRFYTEGEKVIRRSSPPAYWGGEDLRGKHIVVWTEQGLGDEVLHGSILPEVVERAGRCTIECSERMAPVFARSFPTTTVVGYKASNFPVTPPEGIDYQIPLASLGQHFRTDFASFPAHTGYLKADADKVAEIRARYDALAKGRRIVGISWRSKNEGAGEAKSIALSDMAAVLQVPGVMFVNLQYGECADELAEVHKQFGVKIIQDEAIDPLIDMDAFFAQVGAMDLVLSTSNTTAHVAGAQNIPVWVLLPHGKGLVWYWFLRRTDSPWYPSARLMRADHKLEEGPARWRELIERTAIDLARWTEA